jgi:excisionase family DNA binding protein
MAVLLNAKQLAYELSVSTSTVLRLAKAGQIPSERWGRQYRFDLQRVLNACRDQPRYSEVRALRAVATGLPGLILADRSIGAYIGFDAFLGDQLLGRVELAKDLWLFSSSSTPDDRTLLHWLCVQANPGSSHVAKTLADIAVKRIMRRRTADAAGVEKEPTMNHTGKPLPPELAERLLKKRSRIAALKKYARRIAPKYRLKPSNAPALTAKLMSAAEWVCAKQGPASSDYFSRKVLDFAGALAQYYERKPSPPEAPEADAKPEYDPRVVEPEARAVPQKTEQPKRDRAASDRAETAAVAGTVGEAIQQKLKLIERIKCEVKELAARL